MEFSKQCTGPCGEMKPLEAFGKRKDGKDGRRNACKTCRNAQCAAYERKRHKDPEVRAKKRARQLASERERLKDPEYRAKRLAYKRERRNNPEVRAKRLARCREPKRLAKHRDWCRTYMRERRKNPEFRDKRLAYNKRPETRAKNNARDRRPENRAKKAARLRKRRKTDPVFCIKDRLRARLRHALKGISKAATTMTLVGCTWMELEAHLEAQFLPGMTWENRGEWHVDHIIPLKAFDLEVEENQYIVNWFRNLQPMWAADNLKKSAAYEEDDKLDLIRRYRACN